MSGLELTQWSNVIVYGAMGVAGGIAAWNYHRRAPWRSSRTGRHVMGMTVALAVLGVFTVAGFAWQAGVAGAVVRGLRAAAGVWITVLLVQRARMFGR